MALLRDIINSWSENYNLNILLAENGLLKFLISQCYFYVMFCVASLSSQNMFYGNIQCTSCASNLTMVLKVDC